MDPCVPGISLADARSFARVKLGVPGKYASKMSSLQICKAARTCKRTNIMPPMEYHAVNGKMYLLDPKSPISIKDFLKLLGNGSVDDIKKIAKELKLISEYISKKELKSNIIEMLQSLKISEPIEIPGKRVSNFKEKVGNNLEGGGSGNGFEGGGSGNGFEGGGSGNGFEGGGSGNGFEGGGSGNGLEGGGSGNGLEGGGSGNGLEGGGSGNGLEGGGSGNGLEGGSGNGLEGGGSGNGLEGGGSRDNSFKLRKPNPGKITISGSKNNSSSTKTESNNNSWFKNSNEDEKKIAALRHRINNQPSSNNNNDNNNNNRYNRVSRVVNDTYGTKLDRLKRAVGY